MVLVLGVVSPAVATEAKTIHFRLVAAEAPETSVGRLESIESVTENVEGGREPKITVVGDRATLWIRGASVDNKFTFERFHQGKFIKRDSDLAVDLDKLGLGEHTLEPGGHRFTVAADGTLTSDDPDLLIDGDTVALKLYRVDVLAVDAGRRGPLESRLVPDQLGLFLRHADSPANRLPELEGPNAEATTVLSHARRFYPLRVYLPANAEGPDYLLYPSYQSFRVLSGGGIEFTGRKAPGIEAAGTTLTLRYHRFAGQVNSASGLGASVGTAAIGKSSVILGPTLESPVFTAGYRAPSKDFGLVVDNDFASLPNKFLLADNLSADPLAIRLLALEWGADSFERGAPVDVSLRFAEGRVVVAGDGSLGAVAPAAVDRPPTVPRPVARMAYAPYNPRLPKSRRWTELPATEWRDGRLSFTVPDAPFGFHIFRVVVEDADRPDAAATLAAEFRGCILDPGQRGSASFISNRGRDAFVAGEDIRLHAVIRSQEERAAGSRRVRLTHPDGRVESLPFADDGDRWSAAPFALPGLVTRHLAPGAYRLEIRDLPASIAAWPFTFELVPAEPKSAYRIIKPSKYTNPMSRLLSSHTGGYPSAPGDPPVDLERAAATLAELGYNHVDLMSYTTYNHARPNNWREAVAASDARLMAADSVYTPSPRNQWLNACVRNRLGFADVLLIYNDFHLPRYIDGYIDATRRWITREALAMRHSPAFSGLLLYDEMYELGMIGVPDEHATILPRIRRELATQVLGATPGAIRSEMSRTLKRPPSQRDAAAVDKFLDLRRWEIHGWGDFNSRVARAARQVAPNAKIGTYMTSFLYVTTGLGAVCSAADMDCGYPPDVFADLDFRASIHYTDNAGGWVHSPIMVPLLRFGPRRPVYVNIPVHHENYSKYDGQYQRQMAFAMLAQGADGVSMWGSPHDFVDGPNPVMMTGKETTKHLNNEILAPFGDLVVRTRPGYEKVGIVLTQNQLIMSEFKEIRTANQAEEIWIACWRLGFPAVFLREDAFERSLEKFGVIFVPGIRFDGELSPAMMDKLAAAVRAGCTVVVEKGSTLDLEGAVRLDDFAFQNYFLGASYAPSYYDDELNRVWEKTEAATAYLADKLPKWVEPAGRGPFKTGPNWRTSGGINYLVMANFDDPDYGHTVKQYMAKPVRADMTVPAHRGAVAYDLVAQRRVELKTAGATTTFEVDMTRVQGGLFAFLPTAVAGLDLRLSPSADGQRLRLAADLVDADDEPIAGAFPVTITLTPGPGREPLTFFRVLGDGEHFDLDLPAGPTPVRYGVTVRENIAGHAATAEVDAPVVATPSMVALDKAEPYRPYPEEVERFMETTTEAVLVVGAGIPGLDAAADELIADMAARGVRLARRDEPVAWRMPGRDPKLADPHADGMHSWRSGYDVIQPACVVDTPVVILSAAGESYLLHQLAANGFLTELPKGGLGQPVQPTIQVATRGLHPRHDTLCVVANDLDGMRRALAALLDVFATKPIADDVERGGSAGRLALPPGISDAGRAKPPAEPPDAFATTNAVASRTPAPITPATAFMGANEMVNAIELDAAGNVYAVTWGHGDNLYSLDPQGALRFSRHLPEMGVSRLEVSDRVLAFTSAGGRLYQVDLDGAPISQMRLGLDPGFRANSSGYRLAYPRFHYSRAAGAIVNNDRFLNKMRVIGLNGDIVAEWPGDPYFDKHVADHALHRVLHAFAVAPDGKRLAQIEARMYYAPSDTGGDYPIHDSHLVLRGLDGAKLAEYPGVIVNEGGNPSGQVRWEAGAAGPAVVVKDEQWQFSETLELLGREPVAAGLFSLGRHGVLMRDGRALRYVDGEDREICRTEPFDIIPTIGRISPDGKTLAFLDEYGWLTLVDAATGRARTRVQAPELAHVMVFSADSSRLYLGGLRGSVMAYDIAGAALWRTELAPHNAALGNDIPSYAPEFEDHTAKLWPGVVDTPGELEDLVTLDRDRLVNGDCEGTNGWLGDGVGYAGPGYRGAGSLRVGDQTVYQEVADYIGDHFTWALEFHYRNAPGAQGARLLAGLRSDSQYPAAVARELACTDEWQFARIVTKSGMRAKAVTAGFSAEGGEALVDAVTLRRIRFPSINHMLYEPIHEVEPLVLENPLFGDRYDPLGNLREQTPNRVLVQSLITGPMNLVESGFMQNGRLNDVSSAWYIAPLHGRDTNVSLGLKEPRWVSMVALYFNAVDAANVTPHFDIYVTDVATRKEQLVASVRHNRQVFHIAKFAPVQAAQVNVRLVNAVPRQRTLTEVEVYGPLAGTERPGFTDPEGQNTYMGDFTRVDRRAKPLAADFAPPKVTGGYDLKWSFPSAQIVVSEDQLYVSRALGHNERYALPDSTKVLSQARTGSLGFSPAVTLYGGVLLKLGNDGKVYCIDPVSSRELWSLAIGERLTGGLVAVGEDVFVADDRGTLYTLDIASGTILRKLSLSAPSRGSPATDDKALFLVTEDGLLQALDVASGKSLWTTPIASYSESTPAVDNGVVYLGDRAGTARAVDAGTGKVKWKTELGEEFRRCPVVLDGKVVFGCRDGKLAVLDRATGSVAWEKSTKSRFHYEPLALTAARADATNAVAETWLLHVDDGAVRLTDVETGSSRDLMAPPKRGKSVEPKPYAIPDGLVTSISYYKGHLFFIPRNKERGHSALAYNATFFIDAGSFIVLAPAEEATK